MDKDRVILVKGDKSNWYEQAIFIVKGSVPQNKMPIDLVAEAERIINNYTSRNYAHNPYQAAPIVHAALPATTRMEKPKKKQNSLDIFFNAAMLVSCAVLAGVLMYAFVR